MLISKFLKMLKKAIQRLEFDLLDMPLEIEGWKLLPLLPLVMSNIWLQDYM